MTEEIPYHVFLSHNSTDKPAVEELAHRLVQAGLQPWLDKWNLIPGEPWQEALEEALDASASCAVFLGPSGLGTWENEEMRAALDIRASRPDYRIIPVLLPGAQLPERGRLPRFLARHTWVDFRPGLDDADAFHRLVCGIQGVAPGAEELGEAICPFRGLRVFEEKHAPFFFGREALTQYLVERLRGDRFLAVIGPSGSGKSSLVRAGLFPAVRGGALEGSEHWPVVVLKPGPYPLETLAARLLPQLGESADPLAARQSLLDALRKDERGLHSTMQVALAAAPDSLRLLLVVDQFEELFTLCQDEGARSTFIANLLYASGIAGGQTSVVLTMRADYYGRCAIYPDLAARLERNVLVGPMDEEELRRTMEGPASVVGLHYEKGLINTILDDLGDEPGTLPLLQHTLWELWQRRRGQWLTFDAYREIGGVQGALAHRAEEIYTGFTEEEQAITRRVLLRLTQPGEGTEDTRRRAAQSELIPGPEQEEVVEGVVQRLAEARLVTTAREEEIGEDVVDVAHEALIRGWPRLQSWVNEDRAGLLTHRRLTEAAQEWERSGRDESYLYRGGRLAEAEEWTEAGNTDVNPLEKAFLKSSISARKRVQLRRIAVAIAAITAIVVVAVVFSFFQYDRSVDERLLRQTAQAAERTAQAEATRANVAEDAAYAEATRAIQAERTAYAEARIARSRQLAAQAQLALELYPQRALLLGIESLKSLQAGDSRVPAAEEALRQALSNTGGTPLRGSEERVTVVAFSPTGRYAATGSMDGSVRLWDVGASGDALGPAAKPSLLTGHTGPVYTLAFSPDGRYLATGGGDNNIHLWDVDDLTVGPLVLSGHQDIVWVLAFSPDGHYLATGSADNTARLWNSANPTDASAAESTVLRGHAGRITALAFSPDGDHLATGSADRTVRLWDIRDPSAEPAVFEHMDSVEEAGFSPDGRYLTTRILGGTLYVWDAADPTVGPGGLPGYQYAVVSFAYRPDGRYLVTGSADGLLRLWDLSNSEAEPTVLSDDTNTVLDVTFSHDGRYLATGNGDHTIRLWDLNDPPGELAVLRGHDDGVRTVTFGPDGRYLATVSLDGTARLWDLGASRQARDTAAEPTVLRGHDVRVNDLAFSPDGRYLATVGCDEGNDFYCQGNVTRLWDVANPAAEAFMLYGHEGEVRVLAFSPDGRYLATGDDFSTIRLWNIQDPITEPAVLSGHQGRIAALAFSPDGLLLATGSSDSNARVYDVHHPTTEPAVLSGHEGSITAVAFSPDGRYLATASADSTVRLWDTQDLTIEPIVLYGHDLKVEAVAFSPDGRYLATNGEDYTVCLWEVGALVGPSAEPVAQLEHLDKVKALAFSSDSHYLATGGWDNISRLWDVQDLNAEPTLLLGHADNIETIAFSPDGRWLATGGGWLQDFTVRLWDVQKLTTEPVVLRGHTNLVVAVAFSPDAHYLATASEDGTVRLWNLDVDTLLELACHTAGRNLTQPEWAQYFPDEEYRQSCPQWPAGD